MLLDRSDPLTSRAVVFFFYQTMHSVRYKTVS